MSDIDAILANHPGLGKVRLCGCDTIHLSIGPVTVSLAPEAFAQTAILIRDAMEQLREITGSKRFESDPARPAASRSTIPKSKWKH